VRVAQLTRVNPSLARPKGRHEGLGAASLRRDEKEAILCKDNQPLERDAWLKKQST